MADCSERPKRSLLGYLKGASIALLSLAFLFPLPGQTEHPIQSKEVSALHRSRKYVNSIDDFIVHTKAHIERVELLARELILTHPRDFSALFDQTGRLDEELIHSYLSLHDQPKISNPQLTRRLYDNYGRNFRTLDSQERMTANAVRDELNFKEAALKAKFKKNRATAYPSEPLSEQLKSLKRAEEIADEVDRYRCPVTAEEMNKTLESYSDFQKRLLRENPNKVVEMEALRDAQLAAYLEQPQVYKRVTRNATYEVFQKRNSSPVRFARGKCIGSQFSNWTQPFSKTPQEIAKERFLASTEGLSPDLKQYLTHILTTQPQALERRNVYRVVSRTEFDQLRNRSLPQKILWSGTEQKHLYQYGDKTSVLVKMEGWSVPYRPGAAEAEQLLLLDGSRIVDAQPLKNIPGALPRQKTWDLPLEH